MMTTSTNMSASCNLCISSMFCRNLLSLLKDEQAMHFCSVTFGLVYLLCHVKFLMTEGRVNLIKSDLEFLVVCDDRAFLNNIQLPHTFLCVLIKLNDLAFED
uniref:Uncharacterized protein n=1 Tax=Rhipicephalus microplus TaxID=6941 RepID=A0A6G5AHF4_RHIMP